MLLLVSMHINTNIGIYVYIHNSLLIYIHICVYIDNVVILFDLLRCFLLELSHCNKQFLMSVMDKFNLALPLLK
jgi:hypothetical protein